MDFDRFVYWLERKIGQLDERGFEVRTVHGQFIFSSFDQAGRFLTSVVDVRRRDGDGKWTSVSLSMSHSVTLNNLKLEHALTKLDELWRLPRHRRIKP